MVLDCLADCLSFPCFFGDAQDVALWGRPICVYAGWLAPAAASQPAYTQIGRPQRATSCASPKKHGNDKQSARQSRTMATYIFALLLRFLGPPHV